MVIILSDWIMPEKIVIPPLLGSNQYLSDRRKGVEKYTIV